MSKNYIRLLAGVMTITMIWLMIIQIEWIRNAALVQEQQFTQNVNKSLYQIVNKIEEDETLLTITNETVSFSTDSTDLPSKNDASKSNFFTPTEFDSTKRTDVFVISKDSGYWQINSSEREIKDKITKYSKEEIKENIINKINKKTIFVENIINKLIRKEINIEKRISNEKLKATIDHIFANNGISDIYEFAVRTQNNEYTLKSQEFKLDFISKTYEIRMYPNDIISNSSFLVVYFKKDRFEELKKLPRTAGISITLTILISLMFLFTVFILFRQRKLSEIKNDFISNMTHELKTPISTISLASQMLKDSSIHLNKNNIENITRIIDDESKRLGFQVEKVLQTSIYEKEGMHLKLSELDLHEIINNAVLNTKLKIKSLEGSLTAELEAEKPVIEADRMHITNVVFNLLDNAIKYCNNKPEIIINTKNINNTIVVSIQDNGIGIAKEHQKKIFEKFYRVPKGNVHDVKGFGLGLNYVKKIIDLHKANIKIKSELNKGTTFYLTFKTFIKN